MSNVYDVYQTVMAVIGYVREGETTRQACLKCGIARTTFMRYIVADPALMALFAEAEQESYDAMAELLVNIDSVTTDSKLAAVISKNIQWLLDKRAREKYGTKVKVEHDDKPDKLIIEALNAAIARIPLPDHPANLIDAQFVDVTPTREITLADVL